ncbi:Probable adenosine monophosphate-protein transferase fic [uncultured Butyricicoccus sp.]|uniref:protein adenylyltransferase n=1 Tax=Agathobaculum ammoniilyticum TaxID=2981778 RepID=A0ABT2U6B9_9FIRM|nr:Fic family protein [Agathobaculum ammoniilyticum]MCU6790156.1 Fic family protein [Agathobaculum ammoniilyticum]SCJ52331.1 Probable adenosine monophosphate-protein transferase fic [uncultured Butyricicoccus sp.]
MAYSVTPSAEDCYPGTSVLINKLGITDQKRLNENETLITSVKMLQIEMQPITAEPDFSYLKHLHHLLFDEIYSWAGQVRHINISKLRTAFYPANQIEETAYAIFERLQKCHYFSNLPRNELVCELSDLYDSINYLHPFREGNGRVQRLYFRKLAQWLGHNLNFAAVESERLMIATIHASAGVMDDLRQIFDEILV